MSLQRSKYICVEDNITKQNIYYGSLSNQFKVKEELKTADPIDPYTGEQVKMPVDLEEKIELCLRYCKVGEVNQKRLRALIVKA